MLARFLRLFLLFELFAYVFIDLLLVGHSMGGLVARAYLRRYGELRVARLITLGTPHRGSLLAHLGIGRNARQMEPGSVWLRELAKPRCRFPALPFTVAMTTTSCRNSMPGSTERRIFLWRGLVIWRCRFRRLYWRCCLRLRQAEQAAC